MIYLVLKTEALIMNDEEGERKMHDEEWWIMKNDSEWFRMMNIAEKRLMWQNVTLAYQWASEKHQVRIMDTT